LVGQVWGRMVGVMEEGIEGRTVLVMLKGTSEHAHDG
jgi:hypothetical protein